MVADATGESPALSPLAPARFDIDADAFAALADVLRRQEQIPYEDIDAASRDAERSDPEAVLAGGWALAGVRLATTYPPVPWDEHSRSVSFHIHAFDPVSALLGAHRSDPDPRLLDAAEAFARDWLDRFQAGHFGRPLGRAIAAALSGTGTMAWYDMAVGQRIYRLAYILDATLRRAEPDMELARAMFRSIVFQHEMLARDSFFVGHTNHGLYQALGQLAAARRFRCLPGFDGYARLAEERLRRMLEASFFPSGAHREHSPGYHHMILGSVLGARRSGLLDDPVLTQVVSRAEECLMWMTRPDGSLVPFGDTDPRKLRLSPRAVSAYAFEPLRYVYSGGKAGTKPPSGVTTYPDAGYAFARIYGAEQSPEHATHFALSAGFHSRTHKHADHFTFTWFERGREILTDPGRFAYTEKTAPGTDAHEAGFWYADPRRIYVEKTRAHNCVEIDGRDYPRKRARPFGSALIEAGRHDGLVFSACETHHFRKVRHWRGVALLPGEFLLCLDWIYDRSGAPHAATQWFQMAEAWHLSRNGSGYVAEAGGERLAILPLLDGPEALEPVAGRAGPDMLGWRSDRSNSLVPAPTIGFRATRGALIRFATLFQFGRDVETDVAASRANASLSQAEFAWSVDGTPRRLRLGRDRSGRFGSSLQLS